MTENSFPFTYKEVEQQYQKAIDLGYEIITCKEYYSGEFKSTKKKIVNRIDVDFSLKKTISLLDIYERLNVKGSFFIRLHAPEYNPFSFESYRIIKRILNDGHEVGYHSEIIDQAAIWNEDPSECLKRDIDVMERMYGTKIFGVASHGGMTGLNNLDFWTKFSASDFGLDYEAYDNNRGLDLFYKSFYISDSEWTRWKCYNRGVLVDNDHRSLSDHLDDNHPLIYLLIHPDTYYNSHIYE